MPIFRGTVAQMAYYPPDGRQFYKAKSNHSFIPLLDDNGHAQSVCAQVIRCPRDPPVSGASPPLHDCARACVIYSHGNATDIMGALERRFIHFAHTFAVDVVLYDYIGYGLSSGDAPDERLCELSVEAVYSFVTGTLKYPADRIVVCGESIGSVATVHIAQTSLVRSAILLAPVSSGLRVIAPKLRGIVGAVARVLPDSVALNNMSGIKRIRCPVLIVHGTDDSVVPYQCGLDLHEARSKVPLPQWPMLSIPGADHNDLWDEQFQAMLFTAIGDLLEQSCSGATWVLPPQAPGFWSGLFGSSGSGGER